MIKEEADTEEYRDRRPLVHVVQAQAKDLASGEPKAGPSKSMRKWAASDRDVGRLRKKREQQKASLTTAEERVRLYKRSGSQPMFDVNRPDRPQNALVRARSAGRTGEG